MCNLSLCYSGLLILVIQIPTLYCISVAVNNSSKITGNIYSVGDSVNAKRIFFECQLSNKIRTVREQEVRVNR